MAKTLLVFGILWRLQSKKKQIILNQTNHYIQKINSGSEFLKKIIQEQTIYGVTTGYGDSCTNTIAEHFHEKLPLNLARFHGCGLGKHFSSEITRAILAVRLCSLAYGFSGIRFELLKELEFLLQNDILPLIPEEGSVGASGDLTPLSYIARTLIGEEKVIFQNQEYQSKQLFKELKHKVFQLKEKESLALMNGTSVMTAIACIVFARTNYLIQLCSRITAMASIALKGNSFHFDELLFSLKPHKGQMQIAEWIRQDLNDTNQTNNYSRLQDRYSIRCAPHIIGVLADALPFFSNIIETEINSTNDNPVICAQTEKIMHGGHFYGGHIAFVMDSMKVQIANLADMMDRQMALLVDEKFNNGLPANLSGCFNTEKYINHGLKALQISVSAWTAEALKNTMPASVFSRSTECHNQDKVSMGTIAGRDCLRVLELTEQVAAGLLIAVKQALELRPDLQLSANIKIMFDNLNKHIAFIEQDRPLEETLRNLIKLIHNEEWKLYV